MKDAIIKLTSIKDCEELDQIMSRESYTGKLPKYLEPLRPLISDASDERRMGSSFFIYLKRGLMVDGLGDLSTVSGQNQKEILEDFKVVEIFSYH